ncbi:hypothetical protein [Halalkalirubrum salinum]|uniref:hypothetical protein n=1 Tax=Halalkalirubrum salinum TaxID=2563889 RepID=UPI0010FB8D34|nr:hypothetical protein [Halalkalirubrum salinum]
MVTDGRRRFLELAGTGAALSIAGCLGDDGTDTDPAAVENDSDTTTEQTDDDETGGEDSIVEEGMVTVALQADQEALAEAQESIQAELEDEEISQQEAQVQLQETEQELLEEAGSAFESNIDELDGLSIVDTTPAIGAVLVDGEAESMIETLSFTEVSALLSGETYAEIREQGQ